MSDSALIYLEADDEVTSVVRRIRASSDQRVVVVVPGRSRATSSAVALRLLARAAATDGREVAVVGDALTRSLAGEAGLAAYATVDDARRAGPPDPAAALAAPQAAIHVVRGPGIDDTAPTLAAAAVADRTADTGVVAAARAHATAARRRTGAARVAGRFPAALILALAALFLLAAAVAGAMLLPGATVVVVPRNIELPARTYTVTVDDAERRRGTVQRDATVRATGTYPILEYAVGTVTFRNWSGSPVRLEAGTLVAAGVQAFQTTVAVDVPAGRLLPNGTIGAGQVDAPVVAMAPGPDANVGPTEINVVLDETQASRLRAFPQNENWIVQNAAPTSGGSATTGPEITQSDVDAAVAALREDLAAAVADELDAAAQIVVPVGAPEAEVAGAADLVGTRDVAAADISGALAFDAWVVELASVRREALLRLADDDAATPDGHRLVLDDAAVDVVSTLATSDGARVTVAVRASAVRVVDAAAVVDRVRGRPADEAEAALADLGAASVSLWPGWVADVPELTWRIDVSITGAGGGAAGPAASAGATP